MTPRLASLPAAALALTVAASGAGSQSPALHRDTVEAVDRVFARYSTMTPGCAVGVARGGRTILTRGYGMAELEHRVAITPATVFEAGSVSKQFTAFLVLLLEQEGKLSLDDPLRKHLPELPDYGAPLTIGQVLSHTSGLRDWYGIAEVQGLPAGEHHFRNEDLLEMASRQRALNFPSGTKYLYSNTGWNLMALVVERVTGETFQEASRRRIFEPLGMSDTRWREDFRMVVPGRAVAYARRGDGWAKADPFMSIIGAGGLLTTVNDLLRWNENLSTGTVGGRALVDRMQARARLSDGREIGYGLGLMIRDERGTRAVAHGGATGGYRSQVVRFPERNLSVAILCNETGATAADANAIVDVFLGAAPARQAGGVLGGDELRALRGRYRNAVTGEPVDLALRDSQPVASGYRLTIRRRAGDAATVVVGVDANGDSVVLERVAPWSPSAAALREYAGEYESDEAPSTWRFEASGDTLVLTGPGRRRIALRPAHRDAFMAPGLGSVVFRRDGRGRVQGVSFMMGRVRDIRLARR